MLIQKDSTSYVPIVVTKNVDKESKIMNQTTAIKEHLESGKRITSMEAFKLYGCTRLSAKIFNLRQSGMVIDSIPMVGENRYGDTCRFVAYRLSTIEKIKKGRKK